MVLGRYLVFGYLDLSGRIGLSTALTGVSSDPFEKPVPSRSLPGKDSCLPADPSRSAEYYSRLQKVGAWM